jgi:hypothetical protein
VSIGNPAGRPRREGERTAASRKAAKTQERERKGEVVFLCAFA